MKLEKLVGERFREKPSDCVLESHALMVKGGYIKNVANGIFSSFHVFNRIIKKIEQIIREEMDALDGQEVIFPVVMPATLWQESGRYETIGSELLRFKDRNDTAMVLGMTHEEAAVHLVREYAGSYTRYPFYIYQIQTKFRDEARPRGGLIRVKEFTMKDGYSFHTSQQDLNAFYDRCFDAYQKIFSRAGIPEVVAVSSDSGMMGGSVSHEFMLLSPAGEDSVVTCSNCDYSSNMEVAESIILNKDEDPLEILEMVYTPDMKTIEDVCGFLNLPLENSCKAVIYQKNSTDEYVTVFIRGDLELNETKLRNYLKEEIHPAVITEESGLSAGFLGPIGLTGSLLLFDCSLKGKKNLCCGANKPDYHYTGFQIERDYGAAEYHDFAKVVESGICPQCKKPALRVSRGIEVGNIFQLGAKYSKAMNLQYIDENGEPNFPVMGCYGIGIGRLAASVCEAHHDEYGPIWPMSITPWQVHLCCIRADDQKVKELADRLYEEFMALNIETIYDDRAVSAGVMFSDADLLGIPVRVIVSPRNLAENCCEIVARDKSFSYKVAAEDVKEKIRQIIAELLPQYS